MKIKTIFATFIATCVMSTSLVIAAPAYAADPPTDLQLMTITAMGQQLYGDAVCNGGTTAVKSIVFSTSFQGFEPVYQLSLPNGLAIVDATDYGDFNVTTKTWTGLLESGQCLVIGHMGNATVDVGGIITHDAAIVSSVLVDDSINVDPDLSNNTSSITSDPFVAQPSMAFSTRLLTPGPITAGSTISYEATVTNAGAGSYIDSLDNDLPLGLYFLMPPDTTLDSITDDEPSDALDIDQCGVLGPTSDLGPGLSVYDGSIAGCQYLGNAPLLPGSSYKFTVTMTVGADFVSGDTTIYAAVSGNDAASMLFQVYRLNGTPVFSINDPHLTSLTYDNSQLEVTANRCTGQGEITSDGTACFRIHFNKLIYAPSFVASAIDLGGVGEVETLVQLDDNTWELRVKNISLGETLILKLVTDTIRDYSAVMNSVQVLGENTVRYAIPGLEDSNSNGTAGSAAGTSANGTLAATGNSGIEDISSALLLLALGSMLLLLSRRKKASASQ